MMRHVYSNGVMALGMALALSSAACNRSTAKNNDEARGHVGAPINLTGCLQKQGTLTTDYILTQVNEPSQAVGTSGSAVNPQQEQMREAKHAYRLKGDDDQLDKLVGKQVKVDGTIGENSDLNKAQEEAKTDRDRGADIDAGDLARVDVKSIAQVSDSCGGASAR